jgi:hypothetical protein
MKRPISKKEYVIGTFFVLAALLPLATSDEGADIEVLPPVASVALPEPAAVEDGTALPVLIDLPVVGDRA